jgi:hypothetical protein
MEARCIFVPSFQGVFLPNPKFIRSSSHPTAVPDFKVCISFNPLPRPVIGHICVLVNVLPNVHSVYSDLMCHL